MRFTPARGHEVSIGTATSADLAALRDIYRRSSLSNDGDKPNLLANPDALRFSGNAVEEQRTRVATTAGGRVVGFATTLVSGGVIELEDLFVDPDWMRRGIGNELVRDAVRAAQDHGFSCIEVVANPHALEFYEQAGFVHERVVETRFGSASRMHLEFGTGR